MHYNASRACVLQFVLVVYFQGTLRLDTTINLGSPGWWATAFLESNKPKKKWYWQDVIYWVWHSGGGEKPGFWVFFPNACIQKSIQQRTAPGPIARPKMSWWRQRMKGMRPLPLSRLKLLPFKKSRTRMMFWWWVDWILEHLLICSYIIWLVFLLFLSRLVCGCGSCIQSCSMHRRAKCISQFPSTAKMINWMKAIAWWEGEWERPFRNL